MSRDWRAGVGVRILFEMGRPTDGMSGARFRWALDRGIRRPRDEWRVTEFAWGEGFAFREEIMKFVHTADWHVDSPLKGLERYEGAPADRIRRATREAAENVVSLALAEEVDFVVVAGDLFDGKWPDMQTGLWTAGQFRRLERAGIDVYLLRGNHDAASEVPQRIPWPANVHQFDIDTPSTFLREDLGVALHGQGFARRDVAEDLSAAYPPPVPHTFNIGVLHTSLTGDPRHDTYAPTSKDALARRGYDYWALGHIHAGGVVQEREPFIAFSGNTQGRHVNERGAKGCYVVSVEEGRLVEARFQPTDVLRWFVADVSLAEYDGTEELHEQVRSAIADLRNEADGRFVAVRLEVRGACALHQRLVDRMQREEVVGELRNLANEFHDVWIEQIKFATTAPIDVERLRQGGDLVGELLRDVDGWLDAPDGELVELAEVLGPLGSKLDAATELELAGVALGDPDRVRGWLHQAESILATLLVAEEDG